ncbi:MAG: hypothetical protein ABUS79_09920 [Pseudomonadota bacterium]
MTVVSAPASWGIRVASTATVTATVAAVLLLTAATGTGAAVAAEASFAAGAGGGFAPPDGAAAERGRAVASRFDLAGRFEFTFQVNNAFTAQNRRAIATAERRIAAIAGVRKVTGPAGLLAIAVDAAGRLSAGPMLAGGADAEAGETVRQRLIRRSDAIGWFISRDGTQIRLLIDGDGVLAARGAIESAVASSGLVLLSGGAPAEPLWPDPDRAPRPFPRWLPFLLMALAMLPPAFVVAFASRPTRARTITASIAAAVGAAAPGMLAPVAPLRWAAAGMGACAAALLIALVVLARGLQSGGKAGGLEASHVVAGGAPGTRPVVLARAPWAILVPCLALLIAGVVFLPRVSLTTQLWRETSVFFIDVRGDLEEPVVMRELRRLTDFLRAEPGVAHAWSIADLFFAVPVAGEEVSGIPSSPELLHAILARARDDSAVRLELAPDHRQALVGVRWDNESGVDRAAVLERVERYLEREHRPSLLRIDVTDPRLSPATRAVGRGVLAANGLERVLRICVRSGRNLGDGEVDSIDRALRRSALVPVVDLAKLRGEISQEVSHFVEQVAVADAHVGLPVPGDRQRLVDELSAQPTDATVADVLGPLAVVWGKKLSVPVLRARATELHRRLVAVRRGHSARLNFRDILYGADLPTEGVLSEEVRNATLEAMGPIVGVPVVPDAPRALPVDAAAVGGAPNDRALSRAWLPRMIWGLFISLVVTAALLAAIGGRTALGWWPAAPAAAAPLILFPAIAALPIGALYAAFLAGALAGGAAFAVAFAPRRQDP